MRLRVVMAGTLRALLVVMTTTLKDRNGTRVAGGRKAVIAYVNAHCADGAVVIVRTKGARDGDYSIRAIRAEKWMAEVSNG